MLEQEATASFTERKNNARKLGEKAGTKLLFPMLLMLGDCACYSDGSGVPVRFNRIRQVLRFCVQSNSHGKVFAGSSLRKRPGVLI